MKEEARDKAWQRIIRGVIRLIYPLVLREKTSFRLQKLFPDLGEQHVSFEFNRNIRFNLSKTDVGHIPIIYNGYYEEKVTKKIISLGKAGGTFIDVGANYGYYSCIWTSQNPQNEAHAFEASSLNITPLNNNIDRNGLADKVKVLPYALGREEAVFNFCHEIEKQQTGWGGFTMDVNRTSEEVKVRTLDDYASENSINEVEVLKIDTEGADTWVLYGAQQLLEEKRVKHIFYEHNLPRMALLNIEPNEAEAFLEKKGYLVGAISETEYYACPKGLSSTQRQTK